MKENNLYWQVKTNFSLQSKMIVGNNFYHIFELNVPLMYSPFNIAYLWGFGEV